MKYFIQKTHVFVIALILFSCNEDKKEDIDDPNSKTLQKVEEKIYYEDGILEVITEAMDFQTADTINSGWNKIVYKNLSPEVHFIMLDIYPAGKNEDTIKARIVPPFDKGMAFLMEGKQDSAMAAFGKLPQWFPQVRFVGGTGLISPNSTAETIVKLEPGNHIMECYVKMANGTFHVSHGMFKIIHVLEESTSMTVPNSDLEIDISSSDGIVLKGSPSSGKQTFKVNYIDQKPHEHFLGHDVNLVKYEEEAVMDSLVAWMNWMRPTGLKTPTPKGFTFVGGVNNQETGTFGFFEASLSPGNYVLISEVPDADKKGLFKMFEVNDNE